MVVRQIARLLGLSGAKSSAPQSSLRYADPSHDPKNRNRQPQPRPVANPKPLTPPSVIPPAAVARPQPDPVRHKSLERLFEDKDRLKRLTLDYINRQGRTGAGHRAINEHVTAALTGAPEWADLLLARKGIRDRLADARKALGKEGLIGYNRQQEVWYSNAVKTRDLTAKEERFLAAHGLGPGWRNIPNALEAIRWLHQNFTPDEFEHFCVAILNSQYGMRLVVTEKHHVSGADGGFDGSGLFTIDGKPEHIALEAKCYAPERQVGREIGQKLAGVLVEKGWRHGLIMTTGTFSDNIRISVEEMKKRNFWVELIDQTLLVQIMLAKSTLPHGFGLHRTEKGLIYINEEILRQAAAE